MEPHPIRLVVADDLRRSRLTVFFRLLLAIPHLIWLTIWRIGALLRRDCQLAPRSLRRAASRASAQLLRKLVRYSTHLYCLPLPRRERLSGIRRRGGRLSGRRQDRQAGPAKPLEDRVPDRPGRSGAPRHRTLVGAPPGGGSGGQYSSTGGADEWWESFAYSFSGSVGSSPSWRSSAGSSASRWAGCPWLPGPAAYGLRYSAQTAGYLLFLTDRYPDADPRDPAATQPTP